MAMTATVLLGREAPVAMKFEFEFDGKFEVFWDKQTGFPLPFPL